MLRPIRLAAILVLTAFAAACTGLLGDFKVTDGTESSAGGLPDGSLDGPAAQRDATGTGSGGDPCTTGTCGAGFRCVDGSCVAAKTPGSGCAGSTECGDGLTCLDAVCCSQSACGPCKNCGPDGTCSVTIGSAAGTRDPMPNGCAGANACNAAGQCRRVLGELCNAATECVSGNCIDGRCCGDAACPACRNCGATGACDVVVGTTQGRDDLTPTACQVDSTCNASGACTPRWTLVGTDTGLQFPGAAYAIGMGNFLYYASNNNSAVAAQFFRSFDVTTSTLANQGLVSNDLCACGYEGTLVAANGQLHYIANSAKSYSPNKSPLVAWVNHTSYTSPIDRSRGEAAYAVSGNLVYGAGGRSNLLTVQTYDVSSDTWNTVANTPTAINNGCGAAYGGKIYMFGGQTAPKNKMYAYDEANPGAGWTTLADITFSCNAHTGQIWQNKIVIQAGGSIQVFDPATAKWETPLSFPAGGSQWQVMVAGSGGLYAVGNVGANIGIFQYGF